MNPRKPRFKLLICILGLLVLSACSNESSDSQPASTSVTSEFTVPVSAWALPLDQGERVASVNVYDHATQVLLRTADLPITGDEISGYVAKGDVGGLPRIFVDVEVFFKFTYNIDAVENPGESFLLATATLTNIDLTSGVGDANFADVVYDTSTFDDDNDCLSNIEELEARTSLTDSGCVFGVSVIGCCTL